MENTTSVKRIKYIPFIRVMAAIFVLFLHTNSCFWEFSDTDRYWKTANVIECLFYPAVPMFLMISGITLMDFFDRTTLKGYFEKRFKRVFIPFIAWSLIGLVEKILLGDYSLSEVNPKFIYQGLTGTTFVSIFWFFTPLFCIYLSMPLYAAVEKSRRKEVFTYLVIAGFILNQLLPFLKDVFYSDLNLPYSVIAVSGVLVWIPLGWLLNEIDFSKKAKAIIYVFAVIGLLMHIIGTHVMSLNLGFIVMTYKGYQNVPSFLYSIGMFVLLKDIGNKVMDTDKARVIEWLDGYTFAIYMLQFFLLDIFPYFINFRSIFYRLGAPFIMLPLIIAMAWVLRKIPIVKKIVP